MMNALTGLMPSVTGQRGIAELRLASSAPPPNLLQSSMTAPVKPSQLLVGRKLPDAKCRVWLRHSVRSVTRGRRQRRIFTEPVAVRGRTAITSRCRRAEEQALTCQRSR